MPLQSRPIPNIIQGVSQQTPEERRDAQCEVEQNIVNYPTRGATARYGLDMASFTPLPAMPGAFTYELLRGTSEHYLFILYQGVLRIYDLNTFLPCTVTGLAGSTYLNPQAGVLDEDNFRIQSVGDFHFIVNKSIIPQMDPSSLSPKPNPAALVFMKAGNYSTTYSISIQYAGAVYTYTYQTPDNSVEYNFQFVTSNQIAATFFRAMTGIGANSVGTGPVGGAGSSLAGSSGAAYVSNVFVPTSGANGRDINPGSGNVGGTGTTLTSLGFTVKIDGNLILIERANDQNPFTANASDGSGDQGLTIVQDTVQDLSDLPRGGFAGYTVKVAGVGGNTLGSPYYLTFNGNASNGGTWIEGPAPGIQTNFLFSTMPLAIKCIAPDVFQVVQPAWLPRISGDGTTSSFQPGFIGQPITDLAYYNGRFAILGQSTWDLSMAKNVFNFFPQTAQATLDAAPISGQIAASETTATLQRAVVVDEQLVLWAQRAQFRVNSNLQNFTASNIQDPESTTYEFNQDCPFFKVGTSLYFAYDSGGYSRIYVLQYQQGRAVGDTEITAHIPEYIPAGVRKIAGSTPIKMVFVRTDGAPNSLYLYNWLGDSNSLEQSAWNTWTLPAGTILWHSIYKQVLFVLLQRPSGSSYWMTVPLNPASVDQGGKYMTRLDMRIVETGRGATWDAANNTTTFTLPYSLSTAEQANYRVVIRTTSAKYVRGTVVDVVKTTAGTITVKGNISAEQFYGGLLINSSRLESDFYIRTSTGHIPTDRLTIKNYHVNYRNSLGGVIIIVDKKTGITLKTSVGLPGNTMLGQDPVTLAGEMVAEVDKDPLECQIFLVNNTPFPSEWTSVTVDFEMTARAKAMLTPYGGPVQ